MRHFFELTLTRFPRSVSASNPRPHFRFPRAPQIGGRFMVVAVAAAVDVAAAAVDVAATDAAAA